MIPKNITREYVCRAIKEIRENGVPKGRSSKRFLLEYQGKFFPPKYTLALANKYANGRLLDFREFSGGSKANNFLRSLGFKVSEKSPKGSISKKIGHVGSKNSLTRHMKDAKSARKQSGNFWKQSTEKSKPIASSIWEQDRRFSSTLPTTSP